MRFFLLIWKFFPLSIWLKKSWGKIWWQFPFKFSVTLQESYIFKLERYILKCNSPLPTYIENVELHFQRPSISIQNEGLVAKTSILQNRELKKFAQHLPGCMKLILGPGDL